MYWPQIDFVGVDTTPRADLQAKDLELLDASLDFRGFANRTFIPFPYYDYYNLRPGNTPVHEGKFTRFGNVLPLVKEVDDKLVVMDTGDELTVSFKALPPPAQGMTRSYVLKPWAYHKYKGNSSQVEPMPFRNMSMYPYSPGEYPTELNKYIDEWNTRVHSSDSVKEAQKPGFLERIRLSVSKLFNWLSKLLRDFFDQKKFGPALKDSGPKLYFTPQPEIPRNYGDLHYSLNTNYVFLRTNTLTGTNIYTINSVDSDAWANTTMPTPSAPGTQANSAQKSAVAAQDSSRWTTDLVSAEGAFNYQMYKFVLDESPSYVCSLSLSWAGYGEPTPNHEVSTYLWNFTTLSWDQVESKNVGSEERLNILKYTDFQPFCNKCHDNAPPSGVVMGTTINIASTYSDDLHGGSSGSLGYTRGSIKGPYQRGNSPLPCIDCHDPHGSSNVYHLRENLNGETGKSVADTALANNSQLISQCQSCHSGTTSDFHNGCLNCHNSDHNVSSAAKQPDFSQPCINCHKHGSVFVHSTNTCHCGSPGSVKAF
jgi:hypothetical protein